jgi:3-phosphoshikimate 1-carboxyvinyltransferase
MVVVAGDKSIAHRAVLLSLLADGEVRLTNLPGSADVLSSVAAVMTLGVQGRPHGNGGADINARDHVVSSGALTLVRSSALRRDAVVDCGNAGTLARLLLGLLAGLDVPATLVGDASLSSRPMRRVSSPLAHLLGEDVVTLSAAGTLPATVQRRRRAAPTLSDVHLSVPSAQVKSAVLFCALSLGDVVVFESQPTRDHTERLLASLGVELDVSTLPGGKRLALKKPVRLPGFSLDIPGDPSSAAFLWGRAAAVPQATVVVHDVLLSPRRDGFLRALARAGASVEVTAREMRSGETVGVVAVRGARLRGLVVAPQEIPDLIDEIPLLAALLATADGPSRLCGLHELRVKESNRLEATRAMLRAFGADVEVDGDDLVIAGGLSVGGPAVTIAAALDHRIEMTARVLGRILDRDVRTDSEGCEAVSFPRFSVLLDDVERTL